MREHAAFRPDQPTVLITGASRGLGLEFARQYSALGWNVIATCRTPATVAALNDLAAAGAPIAIEPLDVTSDGQVAALAARFAAQPVDVLLNNAGIYGTLAGQALGAMDFEEAKCVFDVNALGGLRIAQAFVDNVGASVQRKIVSLGGGMGAQSIGSQFGGHYFMKMSKAAHLIAMGTLQTEVKDRGITVVMISPGRVDTRLMRDSSWTGPSLSAADSAACVIARIATLDPAMRGRLVTCDGQILPW
jgi:NAD(P)-dependent dehydrogenase (short-subunit alcohol dehydrogenase family)